jgi:hypothetical protein
MVAVLCHTCELALPVELRKQGRGNTCSNFVLKFYAIIVPILLLFSAILGFDLWASHLVSAVPLEQPNCQPFFVSVIF